MSHPHFQLEHSVEADVSPAFAWQFRTDIATWNDPPATFALDGPFEVGTWGTTRVPGQQALRWRIREIRPGESFILEMELERATLSFEWRFDGLPGPRTKLTQRIILSGENAAAYAGQVEAGFGPNLPHAMQRLAAEMAAAQKRCWNVETMQPAEIRVLTAADAVEWWNLRLEALETQPEAFSASDGEHRATSVADVEERLGGDPANTFVIGAFIDRELVGTAGFHREQRVKLRHKGQIWGVYVTPRARRTGIGRAMLASLLAHAGSLDGLERIVLSAATTQEAALALYRSLGFRSFATEPRALKIGDRYVDYESMVVEAGAGEDPRGGVGS